MSIFGKETEELNKKIIDTTIERCRKFYNARILDAVKSRWIKLYEKKVKQACQENEIGTYKNKPTHISFENISEDDFEDADIEEKGVETKNDLITKSEVEEDPDIAALDNISISDLSDVDPPTEDFIIAICDKIGKPGGKRNSNSSWKIKLNGGLIKINGKEGLFHSLNGDLYF